MKKGWRNDVLLVERRERLQSERTRRRMDAMRLEQIMDDLDRTARFSKVMANVGRTERYEFDQ